MLCKCSFKKRTNSTLCSRCGKPCLSVVEYQFVTSNSDEIPPSIDVDKVLKYLVRKIQRRLYKGTSAKVDSFIKTYKRLLLLGSSFAQHVVYILKTNSLKVLGLALNVFSNLSEKIRLDIFLQTLRSVSLEVSVILFLIDGLVIGTRFILDLIQTAHPQSNLYKALIHRVNKSALAERLVKYDAIEHLNVLYAESSTLEMKLIHNHLEKVKSKVGPAPT